jgi:hypothetical protein
VTIADSPAAGLWRDASPRRRILAPYVELLPLIPAAVWFSPIGGGSGSSPFWWLAGLTGLGWALVGRWRTGVVVALVRVFILIIGLQALAIATIAESCDPALDPACSSTGAWLDSMFYPALITLGVFYVVTTVGSAVLVERVRRRRYPAVLAED